MSHLQINNQSMTETHLDEHQTRLLKLTQLKEAGVIPYANQYDKTHSTTDLMQIWEDTSNLQEIDTMMETGAAQTYSTAWRLMTFRSHGKLSFGTIRDDRGDIQVAFVRGQCKFHTGRAVVESIEIASNTITSYKMIDKYFDIWDFIGVKGDLFTTKHGELTLFVDQYQMLSKALRPLGDKWHGIKDEEKQYRQRYLDLTLNQDTYDRFKLRSDFIRYMREFYRDQGFVEVETPVLGNAASGAAAQPFITYHNDFEAEFLLRISPETSLKKATAGRFERVFEIGKQFRNEGSDPSHLQEFTSAEHYAAYWNYEDNMRFTEEMFASLFSKLGIASTITVKDKFGEMKIVDFSWTWERIDYVAWVNKASGIDITTYGMDDAEQLRVDIQAVGHQWVGMDEQWTTTLIDYLYKKVLRPWIVWPAFVYNYPKQMQPLARQNDANPNIVEQFQVVVNGWEIVKAYSELVDPIIQSENFDEQSWALASGDDEATSGDDDFVQAMEYAMPCQSWWGMGIDRIIALLTQQDNLRDVTLFPLMKSADGNQELWNKEVEKVIDKSTIDSSISRRTLLWEVNDINDSKDIFMVEVQSSKIRTGARVLIQDTEWRIALSHNGKDDFYILPWWWVDAGESIETAARREVLEEVGISISEFELKNIGLVIWHRTVVRPLCQKDYCYYTSIDTVGKEFTDITNPEQKLITWRFTIEEAITLLENQIQRFDVESQRHFKMVANRELIILQEANQLWYITTSQISHNPAVSAWTTDIDTDHTDTLVDKYLTDTKLHCQQVGYVMRYFAQQLGEDETLWHTAGLLHDIDRDHIGKVAENHLGEQFDGIMDELGADDHLRRAIKSHYPDGTGIQPENLIEKYLISVDELTGFLYAYARMRPEWYNGIKWKSINKKIKDKQFASWVDRDHLRNCETYLNISLNEFALSVVEACKQNSFPTAG